MGKEKSGVPGGTIRPLDSERGRLLIPAGNAPSLIAAHAALDTGVHGAGTDTLATNGTAIIWAIVFGG